MRGQATGLRSQVSIYRHPNQRFGVRSYHSLDDGIKIPVLLRLTYISSLNLCNKLLSELMQGNREPLICGFLLPSESKIRC